METLDTDNLFFTEPPAKPKPTMICVGTVGEVKDSYIKTSEKSGIDHVITPIVLEALDSGRGITVYLTWRPEYLSPAFGPAALAELQEADQKNGTSEYFIYGKNISNKDEFCVLRGLAGSVEAYRNLARKIFQLPQDASLGGPTPDAVTEALRDFVANNVDATGQARKIGYELVQKRTKTGEVDAEGKPIYVNENQYNLGKFWDVTDKNVKARKGEAERSQGRKVFCFAGTPF